MSQTISSVSLNAGLSKVWAAVTEPAQVKQWQYGSELLTSWAVGNPIRFRNEWEGQVFEQWGTVLEFAPPRRLKYSLFFPRPGLEDKPENYFAMTYILGEADGRTTLTILQDDPRPVEEARPPEEGENPVFAALRSLVENS